MRRTGFKKKQTKPMKRGKLRVVGHSTTAEQKQEIQYLVREIVMKRDGGCILRNLPSHRCSGFSKKDGHLILQADHLISRANSATYADTRLIVCICNGLHGWKKWHKQNITKWSVRLFQRKEWLYGTVVKPTGAPIKHERWTGKLRFWLLSKNYLIYQPL